MVLCKTRLIFLSYKWPCCLKEVNRSIIEPYTVATIVFPELSSAKFYILLVHVVLYNLLIHWVFNNLEKNKLVCGRNSTADPLRTQPSNFFRATID